MSKLFAVLLILGLCNSVKAIQAQTPTDLQTWLQAEVSTVVNGPEGPPAMAITIIDAGQVVAGGYAGLADTDLNLSLGPDTPLRIASVTKTYVAATLLSLAEAQDLSLNSPVEPYLSEAFAAPLRQAGYDLQAIQLHHLLSHTAGLPDHTEHWWYNLRSFLFTSIEWQPVDTVELAADLGPPLAPPGQLFNYSDTGYIMLGQVIEELSAQSLPEALRATLNYDRIGLTHTWWERMEDPSIETEPRAIQYWYGFNMNRLDASVDLYGGGGLIASVSDMGRFYEALFERQLLSAAALQQMLTPADLPKDSSYRYGIAEWPAKADLPQGYGHTGFWGTAVIYYPELGVAIAGAITERNNFSQLMSLMKKTADQFRLVE
ncbi:MAG: serine hydrolase domain-containing protein [Halioglobus sp.]